MFFFACVHAEEKTILLCHLRGEVELMMCMHASKRFFSFVRLVLPSALFFADYCVRMFPMEACDRCDFDVGFVLLAVSTKTGYMLLCLCASF